MGSYPDGFPGSMDELDFNKDFDLPPSSNQTLGLANGFYLDDLDFSSLDPPEAYPSQNNNNNINNKAVAGDLLSSSSDDADFSDSVLKYISQVLMEEDMEEKPCMFHDALALQAAEKSLYEALGEKYPSSSSASSVDHPERLASDSPDGSCSGGAFSDYASTTTTTSSDSHWSVDGLENRPSWLHTPMPSNFVFQSTSRSNSVTGGGGGGNSAVYGSGFGDDLVSNMFKDDELAMQFKKGVEEASKFLPKSSQLFIDVDSYIPMNSGSKENGSEVFVKTEKKDETEHHHHHSSAPPPNRLTGKKSHWRDEDEDFVEERSNKQSAVYVEESELSEMFDKILVCGPGKPVCILNQNFPTESAKVVTAQSNGAKIRGKKSTSTSHSNDSKKETADLRTLLVLCAQAVSVDDRRTANEMLRQIREHSSPLGNGSERLAHYFANSLEARLAGTGTQIYTALSSKKTSAADMLKAYQTYMSVCPFKKAAIIFANHSMMRFTANANTIHIIDFGISYGFQWPALIHRLSLSRPGGSPKLRITGIELPQRGFRPAEGVQETGHRLARYCQRHNVPFEYNAIAQKWETIQVEDLKLRQGEYVVVNSLFRFRNLLDETVLVNSPRDAVLKLIRKINPNVFIPAILSGNYNAPFFVTRFREALFHYSAVFDMCDSKLAREDEMRLMYEKEFYGREIVNVVACEGTERVERPETYKQWQARLIRAGFRQLPLEKELMQNLKLKIENGYDKNFDVDQNGNWLLQGWKGRIVYASSLWVPSSS